MTSALLDKYGGPVPRYTSYPTAVQFDENVGAQDYEQALEQLDPDTPISLYIHIPFCSQLCHYCACHTKIISHYGPLTAYIEALMAEIAMIAEKLGCRQPVQHLHFGGGSPNYASIEDMTQLMTHIREHFAIMDDAEIAMEMDPRILSVDKISAYAELGLTRASLGVQDFNRDVQDAINRRQSFETISDAVENLRASGVNGINFDLMYGLPLQNTASLEDTVDRAVALAPDRLAVFGYAHVPWMKPHQCQLEKWHLPDSHERYTMFEAMRARLIQSGYTAIGLDHFARRHDSMTRAWQNATINRNFQGYTLDTAPALLGLGASAISSLPDLYVQNCTGNRNYKKAISDGCLPTWRGCHVTNNDKQRHTLITQIMCTLAAEVPDDMPDSVHADLAQLEVDGLVTRAGRHIRVTETGRPFLRRVAASFDEYWSPEMEHHAKAV